MSTSAQIEALAVTAELLGTTLSSAAARVLLEDLAEYPEAVVLRALERVRHECRGRLTLPDILARIDDGHPGPEEAWGMLNRFISDERETGLYTEPMRQAWEACDPILKLGDEVGARMCFLETYRKALKRAQETRNPPKWSLTMGSDVERRKSALQAAVEAQRISADYAQSMLPAPVDRREPVAGLLEHDGSRADLDQPGLSERLRGLAAQLRASQGDDETRAMQDEQRRRDAVETQKQQINRLMDEGLWRAA